MTKEEREVMQMALGFVASISPAFICEATHHKKNERHANNEPCPHVAKQKATYEAIEKCLANEALEKKAENARELGLDYEPQRTWVGLTPQERDEINEQVYGKVPHHVAFHAAIEAKLKEKNT